MTYYNNDNPLLDEGKIFDYFIWAYTLDNADTTETANPENKKVYLGWRNYIRPHIINGTNYYL